MSEKSRKKVFYILMAVACLSVMIYAFLTPNMSDDLIYWHRDDYGVKQAKNFFDLFRLEYMHYVDHTGRSVAHFLLRVFLFMGPKWIFNVVSALVFMIQSLLIYANIEMKKKYDIRVYAIIICFLWIFDPAISDTVFWEDGACNYLFTTTIILGFITYFRKCMIQEKKNSIRLMITMAIMGILAGWCNENTSGGAILFIMMLLFLKWRDNKSFSFVKPWMVSGFVGSVVGFLIMFLAPANFSRKDGAASKEAHSGVLGIMARFLKMVLNVKNNYLILVLMFVVLLIIIRSICVTKEKYVEVTSFMKLIGFVALATVLSLIAVPDGPQLRAYYGAGIFLMIAVINGLAVVMNMTDLTASAVNDKIERMLQGLYSSAIIVMMVCLSFEYIECGALVSRVFREYSERYLYLAEQAAAGETDVVVPILRPDWKCRFTETAYNNDILLGDGYPPNVENKDEEYSPNYNIYACHYGLDSVIGVERDGWSDYPEYSFGDYITLNIMK